MGTNGARWVELAGQAIFHGLVASLFAEALVRSWGVRAPRQRMALRVVPLAWALLAFPALVLAFPARAGQDFGERWALLTSRSWDDLSVLGVRLLPAWVALLSAAGAALFLLDLVPLAAALRRPRPEPTSEAEPEDAAALREELPRLAAALGLSPPAVTYLARDAPVLFCTGVRRPAIVISRGAVRLLDRRELRAALAHELAHLARRDPTASWILMAARAVLFFSPAFQVVSRAIAKDAEWLADDDASRACDDRLSLASGLIKLHRATSGAPPVRRTLPFAAALVEPLDRARSLDVEVRCRRLLDPAPAPLRWGRARVALAAGAIAALLFLAT